MVSRVPVELIMTNETPTGRPLLSVCIPTYNGARRIESALYSLAPQIAALGDEVELIVSDNCSADDTREVVERARQWGPIRYHRNDPNVGQARNVLRLANELARGEFAWVLGDDDIVREGGVARVVRVLKENPDIDYVYVNVTVKPAAERNAFGRAVNGDDFPELTPVKARDMSDRRVENWNELVDPEVDTAFLGSLMVSVVRLTRFQTYRPQIGEGTKTWASLEHAYVLPTVLAHTMPGRKAYYIGHPCIISFQGEQEWLGYNSVILLVRLQELLDRYRDNGVEEWRVERCRLALLRQSEPAFQELMLNPQSPGREFFSLAEFVRRNRHHPKELSRWAVNLSKVWASRRMPPSVYQNLRAAKRRVWQLFGGA
jgi:glycosyltransferase involved in cell wall biosynthesis